MKKFLPLAFGFLFLIACKQNPKKTANSVSYTGDTLKIEYATGFSIIDYGDFKVMEVADSPQGKTHTYLLTQRGSPLPKGINYNERILIPVHHLVATSTTHIPALELLQAEKSLIGFPNTDYISSPKTRKRIAQGAVTNLGENENINTEILLSLQPEILIGFSLGSSNESYKTISQSGIPVLYNSEWAEEEPLGKAEWIKFFGVLFNKEKEADQIFNQIKEDYLAAKAVTDSLNHRPEVITGSLFKDIWHVPKGNSWAAHFFEDAHADYLYKDLAGTGSLPLSFERVFDDAGEADFWISPGQFTSYQELEKASKHYTRFKAFREKNIYTYVLSKGKTGGILYFEMAPTRPDLVLKDLIHIFHPGTLPDYQPAFYKPLL